MHTLGRWAQIVSANFGNRTLNAYVAATDCKSTTATTTSYNGSNKVTFVSQAAPVPYSAPTGFTYDAGSNVTVDGQNQYVYDGEGRLCAVKNMAGQLTAYVYDAEGLRVAKGSITSLNCDLSSNGFTLTNQYLLDQGGDQVTELTGAGVWKHSNVWAGAHLEATYDLDPGTNAAALHFHLSDPLGTRRVQTNVLGQTEETCQSLPFGDGLSCTDLPGAPSTADDATEHHFTGKERDTESGNDYFGARYYASSMGRFLSPDWSDDPDPIPYADTENPQSFNLYTYAGNNPMTFSDEDGHSVDCGGGGDKSLVCLATSFWDWLTKPRGSSNSNNGDTGPSISPPNDPGYMPHLKTRDMAALAGSGVLNTIHQQHWIPPFLSGAPTPSYDCSKCTLQIGIVPWGMPGSLGVGLTGTKSAMTIAEKLALEAAEANPANGKVLQTVLNDSRWPSSQGWVKMESRSPGGIVVHWVRNTITGVAKDFKLK